MLTMLGVAIGIFAITKERLNQRLALYAELGINADIAAGF